MVVTPWIESLRRVCASTFDIKRRPRRRRATMSCRVERLEHRELLAAGALDLGFDGDGKVLTNFSFQSSDSARATVVQPDGKIVVAGDSNGKFALARYDSNGSLDASFGSGGIVTTTIGSGFAEAHALALQPDGKIVVAGNASNGSNQDFAVARYTSAGVLDTGSFGGAAGFVMLTGPIQNGYDTALGVAVQADGKIIVVGHFNNQLTGAASFRVIQYDSAGMLVPGFGTNGIASGGSGVARSVVIQPDGKLLVAGQDESGSPINFMVQRFNPTNGTLDTTFGTSGKTITPVGSGASGANALALYADGRIVAAGYAASNVSPFPRDFALVQYSSTGTVTTGLDGDGIVTTAMGSSGNDEAFGVIVQPNDKIVASGVAFNGTTSVFALARYTTAGTLDPTFAGTGKVLSDIAGSATGAALQTNAKLVVTGPSGSDFSVARYDLKNPPVVTLPTTDARIFFTSRDPILVDAAATVSDDFLTAFNLGTLTVTTTIAGGPPGGADRLAIQTTGLITVSGSNVTHGGVTIATFTGGITDSSPLVVTLNSQATVARVQDLVRAITYGNTNADPTPVARTVTFLLADNFGLSTPTAANVEVGDVDILYRAYHKNENYHFFTVSRGEFLNLFTFVNPDGTHVYRDEMHAGFSILTNPVTGASPLYRLRSPSPVRHYYTMDAAERDYNVLNLGYTYEGITGYMFALPAGESDPPPPNGSGNIVGPISGTIKIFHLYFNMPGDQQNGARLFTRADELRAIREPQTENNTSTDINIAPELKMMEKINIVDTRSSPVDYRYNNWKRHKSLGYAFRRLRVDYDPADLTMPRNYGDEIGEAIVDDLS